jgi:fermentation-respiration switch protein FrsA (DUF1100 family)
MTDQYRTIDRIGSVKVPLLIVHGARDSLIPVHHVRHVYAAANEPKTLAILRAGDHNDLFDHGACKTLAILRAGDHNDLFDHGAWQKVTAFFDAREPVRPAIVRPVYAEHGSRQSPKSSGLTPGTLLPKQCRIGAP